MMYNFLTIGKQAPTRLGEILSAAFEVTSSAVDVSEVDEVESRNWDAWVSCEYEGIRGDLDWSISVYTTDEIVAPPAEGELGLVLSQELQSPVLFPSDMNLPSSWRVATPRGTLTYARVIEPEHEDEGLRVQAVEEPVPELPNATVLKLPEIIKLLRLGTPVTDSYFPQKSDALQEVRGWLVNWERLTVRMTAGWPPSQWYPASLYREDLEMRDQLDDGIKHLPDIERGRAQAALEELDSIFRGLTIEDGGHALAQAIGIDVNNLVRSPWYWRRRPPMLPWDDASTAFPTRGNTAWPRTS